MATRLGTNAQNASVNGVTALLNGGTVQIRTGAQPASVVDGTKTVVWLTGGSEKTARATCRITTAAGRVEDRSLHFEIVL